MSVISPLSLARSLQLCRGLIILLAAIAAYRAIGAAAPPAAPSAAQAAAEANANRLTPPAAVSTSEAYTLTHTYTHNVQELFKKAVTLAHQSRTDDAVKAYNMLIQQYPELPELYNNLAALYAQKGDYLRARVLLETAISANPNFILAYQNLGVVYRQLSAAAFQRAQALRVSTPPSTQGHRE